jgi:hypothetical protein
MCNASKEAGSKHTPAQGRKSHIYPGIDHNGVLFRSKVRSFVFFQLVSSTSHPKFGCTCTSSHALEPLSRPKITLSGVCRSIDQIGRWHLNLMAVG